MKIFKIDKDDLIDYRKELNDIMELNPKINNLVTVTSNQKEHFWVSKISGDETLIDELIEKSSYLTKEL